MRYLALFAILMSFKCFAAFEIDPGLWKINVVMKINGKEFDPTAGMEKALANMPADKKKKMLESMGNVAFSDGGTQVCYSKESLKKAELFSKDQPGDCASKIVFQSSKKITTDYQCKDGTKGKGVWEMKSNKSYIGYVTMDSPSKGRSEMNYNGSFVKSDCGSLKPL